MDWESGPGGIDSYLTHRIQEEFLEKASQVGSAVENPANAGDPDSIPGLGRCPGGGNGNPLQCSCLENPMDGGVCSGGLQSMGLQRVGHDLPTKPPPVPGSRKDVKGSYILLSGCKRRKAPQTTYTQFTELTIGCKRRKTPQTICTQFTELTISISKLLNKQTFVVMISAHYGNSQVLTNFSQWRLIF